MAIEFRNGCCKDEVGPCDVRSHGVSGLADRRGGGGDSAGCGDVPGKLGLQPEELLPYGKTPKLDFLRIMGG